MPFASRLPQHSLLMAALALTRLIGWGSTYYALPLLVEPMGREIGVGTESAFAGITILLITGALLGPVVGRHLDRHGTRRAMCGGTVICALGFCALTAAQGPAGYLASWFVLGVGHALMLGNVGSVTIAQLMGERARRIIGLMMRRRGLHRACSGRSPPG